MKKRLDKETIEKLYEKYKTPGHVKRHCYGVTDCAMRIAKALNDNGHHLDLDLVYGASMVHDVARAYDYHWNVAADALEKMGYYDEAKIVRVHMKPNRYSPIYKVHEGDMLNLGDRLVKDGNYVGIDERFAYIIEKTRKKGLLTEERKKAIEKNKHLMQKLLYDIEKEIGCKIDDLFSEELKAEKEKTVSFIDSDVKAWLDSTELNGLCFKKWKADYVIDGLTKKKKYDLIEFPDKAFEITRKGKHCYKECTLDRPCKLAKGVCFGKPVGMVEAVCISEKKGEQKKEIRSCEIIEDWGLKGDAHAGKWHRQVSILSLDSVLKMQEALDKSGLDLKLKPGDFGENIIVKGLDLSKVKIGDAIRINGAGGAVLEVTQIGKECHSDCKIKEAVGTCIMPKEGIFLRASIGGKVKKGMLVELI